MQLSEVTARQKLACPACGGEAQWNPAKQSLVCAYCGTESPYEVKADGEIVEHDLVSALQSIPQSARGFDRLRCSGSRISASTMTPAAMPPQNSTRWSRSFWRANRRGFHVHVFLHVKSISECIRVLQLFQRLVQGLLTPQSSRMR